MEPASDRRPVIDLLAPPANGMRAADVRATIARLRGRLMTSQPQSLPRSAALLTRVEAASYTRCSPASFARHCPVLPVGAPKRWRRAELDAWIAAGQPRVWYDWSPPSTPTALDGFPKVMESPIRAPAVAREPERDQMSDRKHLSRKSAKGHVYWYFAPPKGRRVKLTEEHGSTEFWCTLERLNREYRQTQAGAAAPAPAVNPYLAAKVDPETMTVADLADRYEMSEKFATKATSTREGYGRNLKVIRAEIGTLPIAQVDRAAVLHLRDTLAKTKGYRAADYVMQTLGAVFSYGGDRGAFAVRPNPMVRIGKAERPKGEANAAPPNRRWADWEVTNFLTYAPEHIAIAAALGRYAGLRKMDCLTWTWDCYSGAQIETIIAEADDADPEEAEIGGVTSKRRVAVQMEARPELRAMLDKARRWGPVMVASARSRHGMTYSGFNASWQAAMADLRQKGLVGQGLTHHGLRHSFVAELAEAGCTVHEIMSQSGHKSTQSVEPYVRQAQQAALSAAASAKLAAARAAVAARRGRAVITVDHEPDAA